MSVVTAQYVTSPTGESEIASHFVIGDTREEFTLFNVTTVGEEYTLSFWVKSSVTSDVIFNGVSYQTTTDWTKHIGSFTADSTDLILEFGDTGDYDIYHIKLENGTVATEWTASPRDIEDSIKDLTDKTLDTQSKVAFNEAAIEILNDSIRTLVRDASGQTLMTQDGNKWVFNMGAYDQALNDATNGIADLSDKADNTENSVNVLAQQVDDIGAMTEYVAITTYDGKPCLELGKADNDFKVRITNEEIDFLEGTSIPAYVNNQKLMIEQAEVKNELQFGNFIWKIRSNGNMGIIWKGASS